MWCVRVCLVTRLVLNGSSGVLGVIPVFCPDQGVTSDPSEDGVTQGERDSRSGAIIPTTHTHHLYTANMIIVLFSKCLCNQ